MASMPPGNPPGPPGSPTPGGTPLDGPPPSPAMPAGAPGSGTPMMSQQGQEGGGREALDMLMQSSAGLDQFISSLAQTFPMASEEFGAAREALKAGYAKVLASAGQAPGGSSPTPPRTPLPGGSMSSPTVG